MKQFVTLLIFILCSSIQMNAQTYLDYLKQKNPGQGVECKSDLTVTGNYNLHE